ncbi:MAG: MBL fold metallo-hydrolase [Rubripirellula sp.]
MLLKYFYDQSLAHASYMLGCQSSGEALIIDPSRNITPYLEAAQAAGLQIVAAAETHIHADFVSGSCELAEQVGAMLHLSNAGPTEWKYDIGHLQNINLVTDGDTFHIGNIQLEIIHTPGHTPESISLLITDHGGGATAPIGIFTGDFVFVGSMGRPDLLETAAGFVGSAKEGARDLFHAAERFKQLPDYLQVWPAHGAGSACGKNLGAIQSTTVGYEKRFNPSLQFDDETSFVQHILADQPETPRYFGHMKRVNQRGARLLRDLHPIRVLQPQEMAAVSQAQPMIDIRPLADFERAHLPGSMNIPLADLGQWAGSLIDYESPLTIIGSTNDLVSSVSILRALGVDLIEYHINAVALEREGLMTEKLMNGTPESVASEIQQGSSWLLDVRSQGEWHHGHAPQAHHHFLGDLKDKISQLPTKTRIITQCMSGKRSAIAASLLQASGFNVINMTGGFPAWKKSGLTVVRSL